LPEHALYKSLTGFNISHYIFNKNYSELLKIIEFITNNPESECLMDIRNRDQLNKIFEEVIRLIHNFVASAISLVDHTRNIYKKLYSSNGEFPDYQDRINVEFASDPLVQFVHCLRQYCQHYRAPDISLQVSFTGGKMKKTVNLLKEDLRIFDSWNATAIKYLDSIKERVDVYELITIYHKKVLDFHVWFNSRQKEIHKIEFDLLRKKEEELLTAQLDHFLDTALSIKEKSNSGEVDIFYGIFNSRDYKELSGMPMNEPKRCARAIELIEMHLPVSDNIKKKINAWYKKQSQ
jgi:hypothetical protein